jgi:hypothetical protein
MHEEWCPRTTCACSHSRMQRAAMTTKRAHGPCTCQRWHPNAGHEADCPSLYPSQKEPDALTRLVRLIRESDAHPTDLSEAMDLISEAREEQRRARAVAARATVAWRIGREVWDERYRAEAAVLFMLNGRWDTCVECPRDADDFQRPDLCANTDRGDHWLDGKKDSEP